MRWPLSCEVLCWMLHSATQPLEKCACSTVCLPNTLVRWVQILGHSLGAGTACMLAMLVRNNEQVLGVAVGSASSNLWRCCSSAHATVHAAGLSTF